MREIFSICKITQPEETLNIICRNTELIYILSELEAPSHSWSDRFDLEKEEKGKPRRCSRIQRLPIEAPYHNTPSRRGRLPEHEKDLKRYLYEGFLPVRGPDFDTLPHAERTAIEWREFIENEREKHSLWVFQTQICSLIAIR